MKRLLILTACAALLLSGCRNCGWFKRNRGAPCRSNLTFDPYTTAPATVAPGCGIDAYAGEIGCGQDITVGYGAVPNCPDCQVGGGTVVSGDYYGPSGTTPVEIESQAIPQPPPVPAQ